MVSIKKYDNEGDIVAQPRKMVTPRYDNNIPFQMLMWLILRLSFHLGFIMPWFFFHRTMCPCTMCAIIYTVIKADIIWDSE